MFKSIKIAFLALVLSFVFSPIVSLAQSGGSGGGSGGGAGGGGSSGSTALSCPLPQTGKTIGDLIAHVTCLIYKTVVPMFFAIAVALFLWGVIQYIINEGEEAKREKGKQFMLWGLIGLTVMVTVWALVGVLGSTFGISTNILPSAPGSQ